MTGESRMEMAMNERRRFDVQVRQGDDRWYIDVASLAFSAWAPSFIDAEPAAREIIATVLGVEEHSFDVTIDFGRRVEYLSYLH
jgi:hypothetical protein